MNGHSDLRVIVNNKIIKKLNDTFDNSDFTANSSSFDTDQFANINIQRIVDQDDSGLRSKTTNKNSRWKFHISVSIEDLQNEFLNDQNLGGPLTVILNTIKNDYKGNTLQFKMTNFAKSDRNQKKIPSVEQSRVYYGTQFTFYIFIEGSENETYQIANDLRKAITIALKQNNIRPGIIPSSDLQLDDYSSVRNEQGDDGNYIPAITLKPGEWNNAKSPIPEAFKADVDLAINKAEEFNSKRIQSIAHANQFFQKKIKQLNERNKTNATEIKEAAAFVRHIIFCKQQYPEQAKQLLKIFAKKTDEKKLDFLQSVFEQVYKDKNKSILINQQNSKYNDDEILAVKNDILKERYKYKKQTINRFYIGKFLKMLPLFILGFPLLGLPCIILGLREEKKTKEQEIDVQPVILTGTEHATLQNNKEQKSNEKKRRLYYPAEVPPSEEKNQEAKIINKRKKFKLGSFFFKPKAKTSRMKLYLPQLDVSKIERNKIKRH